jgi:zinc finger HIT domain-containing protein 3
VSCSKTHREDHPPDQESPKILPIDAKPAVLRTKSSTDSTNPWAFLDNCEPLRYLFKKYPRLPQQLKEINAATLPPSVDSNTKIAGVAFRRDESWNSEVGIQKGLKALRKAREASGEDGEAVREYYDLIVHLVHGQGAEGRVSDALQQNRAEEEKKFLQELMEANR